VPSLIDTYIAELAGALHGPGRAKDDLLTEARDSLVDATEAYVDGGLDEAAAQRQAVRDFGAVADIAPGYQAELGLAQGRRTALLILFVFAAQPFVWGYAFHWVTGTPPSSSRTGVRLADDLVENLGGITLLVSMLAVLAYRIGMRSPAVRTRLARLTGIFALVVAGVFTGFSAFLTAFGAWPSVWLLLISLMWTAGFIVLPMSVIAVWARRCLVMTPAHR
jgi:hypothetical protein